MNESIGSSNPYEMVAYGIHKGDFDSLKQELENEGYNVHKICGRVCCIEHETPNPCHMPLVVELGVSGRVQYIQIRMAGLLLLGRSRLVAVRTILK